MTGIYINSSRYRPPSYESSPFWQAVGARFRGLFPARQFIHERDGVCLPPQELRAAGAIFRDDESFRTYAMDDVAMIERYATLEGTNVLDFGCGAGRFYFGLKGRNEPHSYLGVDIRSDVVDWTTQNISTANGRFRFLHSDVQNERYNPHGTLANSSWTRMLLQPFDIIYSYSVLSHLTEHDATAVLNLFARIMRPESLAFVTAFIGEQPERVLVNPPDAGIVIHGPLHVVRYRREYLRRSMLHQFEIVAEERGAATDGQTFYVLRLRSSR
jgi:SAM-dependent methyltransferase